jgi:hypothetical protein
VGRWSRWGIEIFDLFYEEIKREQKESPDLMGGHSVSKPPEDFLASMIAVKNDSSIVDKPQLVIID